MKTLIKTFPNGVRLVYEKTENTKPATILICVNTGSVNEDNKNNGISHLIEHMAFKGTKNRTAKQISQEFEELGAIANAYTGQFRTCYFATTLNENIEGCFNILSDIVFNSSYDEVELEKEKKVIYEEIDANKDVPDTVIYENYLSNFYKNTPIERRVIGKKEILEKITRQDILDYFEKNYVGNRIVVSVVGSLPNQKIVEFVKKYICKFFRKKMEIEEPNKSLHIIPDRNFVFEKKDINQSQIIFGFPADNVFYDKSNAYPLMSFIFGGGMASRLFQKVREEHGLVYSIFCQPYLHSLGGDVLISFSTNEKNVKKAMALIKEEIDKLVKDGITDKEYERAKTFSKSVLISSFENGASHATKNATNLSIFNKIFTVEDILEDYDKISKEDINQVIKKVFNYCNICGNVLTKNPDETLFDVFK